MANQTRRLVGFNVTLLPSLFDRFNKSFCEIAQFPLTHAGNLSKLFLGCWITTRHFAQRDIGKNHVGGHVALVRKLAAQNAQLFKQRFVALNFTRATLRSFARFDIERFGQRNRIPIP